MTANGEGWIGAAVFADQEAEAGYIATEIDRLHKQDNVEWKDIAILVRSRRYLDVVLSALEERDIPFEMPDLGGLLKVPAVTDMVAWFQVLSNPGPDTNRWAARILLGPRFRVHYRDLSPIARWEAARNYELLAEAREALGISEPDPGEVRFSLIEALEHADEIEGVSEEARERIAEFLVLTAELRTHIPRGLQQLAQTVADRTGISETLAASASRSAPAMRENLSGFIGVCAEFAPLEGEANLATFLEFLNVAEESEDPIPLAMTAATDSVKVLTIHKAKGLEFDCVFLPHVAAQQEESRYDKGMKMGSLFPDVRLSNPLTSTKQLPPGVRKDARDLPQYDGRMRNYRDALKQRAEQDERRLFYVAITRARKRLYVTAAHWYASEDKPKGPSVFWDEVAAQGDLVDALPGHLHAPADDANPVVESMRSRLVWPPPPFDDRALPWVEKIDAVLSGRVRLEDVLSDVRARVLYSEHVRTIQALEAERKEEPPAARVRSLPATAAAKIAAGEQTVDAVLHPLPQRPTDAQRLGTEVHAWIEELHRGLVGLAEEEALDSPSVPPDRTTVELLQANFASMGFADRRPYVLSSGEPATELPFTLKIGEIDGGKGSPPLIVRGRIDAVYERDDGTLEIVDFKTGEVPDAPDWGQLELYAEALTLLGLATAPTTLTYAYLRGPKVFSCTYTPRGIRALEAALV